MFAPQVPGFPKAFLNDLPSVEKLLHAKTVAIMLEPVQGEAGVLPATPAFLHGLREICDREKLLLICDEVQTGCGRLGTLWGFESFPALVPSGIRPLVPDIMTLGKGIGGGVPLAALCAKESVSVFETGEQGGTYNGNPLMCAAGLAVINEVRQPEFLKHVLAMGEFLAGGLRELSDELGLGEVRGKGLLLALELGKDIGGQVVVSAREEGLLLNSPRPACLRFMPALNVTPGEIDLMLQVLRRSIAKNI
jgi:acetylornithine/N-succinyldiaminopimelate aminotransferase